MSNFGETKVFDIIEIIPSHYKPEFPIGNKYVVVGTLNNDGSDAEIIDENGDYRIVCMEDYKVIGNVQHLRESFMEEMQKPQSKNS